jgi:hypothetical protein
MALNLMALTHHHQHTLCRYHWLAVWLLTLLVALLAQERAQEQEWAVWVAHMLAPAVAPMA